MKRYFIVGYTCSDGQIGQATFECSGGVFINRRKLNDSILGEGSKVTLVINSIIELSEKDYNYFTA